jgi:hypothetical protein
MRKRKAKEKELDPLKTCRGGLGWSCQTREAHEKLFGKFDEGTFTCMKCGGYQGCMRCLANVGELMCSRCEDWANLLSLKRNGPMIKDPALKAYGLKLVCLRAEEKISQAEFNQLWNTACGLTGEGLKH